MHILIFSVSSKVNNSSAVNFSCILQSYVEIRTRASSILFLTVSFRNLNNNSFNFAIEAVNLTLHCGTSLAEALPQPLFRLTPCYPGWVFRDQCFSVLPCSDQGGRSERRTHEERRWNYDVTRWLPLRAVTSRMTNVSLAVLTLYNHYCQFRVSINVKTSRLNARLIKR